jgi:hypothetical protein
MPRPLRTLLIVLLALAAVGTLLYRARGAIGLEGFSWERLSEAVGRARPGPLLFSVLLIYLCYALRAVRWARFSRYLGRLGFWGVYSATLMGFASIFLLGRAGEPIRPLLIARKEKHAVSSAFGIYVLERVFDMAATAVLAGLALLVFPQRVFEGRESAALLAAARTTGGALFLALVAAVGFLVYFRFHGAGVLERSVGRWRAAARPGWRTRLGGLFEGFGEGLHAIRTLGDLAAALVFSAAHWFGVLLVYYWGAQAFGGRLAELDLPSAMLVLAFTMVGSTLQLPGVGGGAQLATFLAFTVIFGVEKEPAAAASIVLWLITFAASSLAGVPLLIREGWSMGELRRLAREEAAAEAAGTHLAAVAGPPPRAGKPPGAAGESR